MALSKIKSDSVDSIAATKLTGTVDNARITLDAAEIPNLDAAKITTGSIANARVPAAAVTQHVAVADLTPAHQGIANLGLIMATEHNKVAFNLTGSFIDIFQDDSGVTTNTTVERHSSEYYYPTTTTSSWSTPAYDRTNRQSRITVTTNHTFLQQYGGQNSVINMILDGVVDTAFDGTNEVLINTGAAANKYFRFDFGSGNSIKITEAEWFRNGTGTHGTYRWQGGNDGTTWTTIGADFTLGGTASPPATVLSTGISGNTTGYRWYQLLGISGSHVLHWDQGVNFKESAYTSSSSTPATATLISDPQTAASTTEVSGVFTYTDSTGTNTIGTDLKIYFTANNGANWTEASSYGTATTFSGSIKQVKLGKTTVTAGTQVALKAVWANQVAASSSVYVTGARSSSITPTSAGITVNGSLSTLIDGNTATSNGVYFTASSPATDGSAYIRFQFSTSRVITEAKYHTSTGGYANGTWRWQGSDNGSSWTNIGNTFVLGVGADQLHTELNGNTTSYLYYQMTFVSGSVNGSEYQNEIEFKEGLNVTGKVAHLNGWAVNY